MKPAVLSPARRSRSRCSIIRRISACVPVRKTRPLSRVYLSSSEACVARSAGRSSARVNQHARALIRGGLDRGFARLRRSQYGSGPNDAARNSMKTRVLAGRMPPVQGRPRRSPRRCRRYSPEAAATSEPSSQMAAHVPGRFERDARGRRAPTRAALPSCRRRSGRATRTEPGLPLGSLYSQVIAKSLVVRQLCCTRSSGELRRAVAAQVLAGSRKRRAGWARAGARRARNPRARRCARRGRSLPRSRSRCGRRG